MLLAMPCTQLEWFLDLRVACSLDSVKIWIPVSESIVVLSVPYKSGSLEKMSLTARYCSVFHAAGVPEESPSLSSLAVVLSTARRII